MLLLHYIALQIRVDNLLLAQLLIKLRVRLLKLQQPLAVFLNHFVEVVVLLVQLVSFFFESFNLRVIFLRLRFVGRTEFARRRRLSADLVVLCC